MITEEQAVELIRIGSEWLAIAIAMALATVGICWPLCRKTDTREATVLYFRRASDRLYPVVNLGTAESPRPVTVRPARVHWDEKVGDVLTVTAAHHPWDTRVADEKKPWLWGIGVCALGLLIAGGLILCCRADLSQTLKIIRSVMNT